jgi:propanol-preferring alcohol dehydrogenase
MHGALVTAVAPQAFSQALSTLRRKGTLALNGLPPGSFDLDIFNAVLNRITIRGSIVGTRKDLQESIDFATEGKVKASVHAAELDSINSVLDDMRANKIEGRMVLNVN